MAILLYHEFFGVMLAG